jgi:hypothetical protein
MFVLDMAVKNVEWYCIRVEKMCTVLGSSGTVIKRVDHESFWC